MSYEITIAEIKAGFPTTVPDAEITLIISMLDAADACLTAGGVSADKGTLLKLYAARHLLTLQANQGRGQVRSESAPSGASRSFASWTAGAGIQASAYGSMLKQLDVTGCLVGLLENDTGVALFSSGPRYK